MSRGVLTDRTRHPTGLSTKLLGPANPLPPTQTIWSTQTTDEKPS
jgi:hypothetical protein